MLADPTGSRRFVCIEINGNIRPDRSVEYGQLYAQAVAALRAGDIGSRQRHSFYFLLMLFPISNFKINETGLRPPCFPVQAPVLYGFRQMACLDIRRGFQVGDRTGDFQDAVVGASGKIEALHGDLQ